MPDRPSPRKEVEELRKFQIETEATIRGIQQDVADLKQWVSDSPKRGRWWRSFTRVVNAITLLALILGAGFQIWLNRPVVDYELTVPVGNQLYLAYQSNLPTPPVMFYFDAANTGQTDITLAIVITAVNATVSAAKDGPFRQNATVFLFISAKTNALASFYARPDDVSVSSFKVLLLSRGLVDSPDRLTTFVDYAGTYNPINAQYLVWVKQSDYPPTFVLQT
jgi:hypothetical protein